MTFIEHGVAVLEGLGRRLLDGKGRAGCRHNRCFALEVRTIKREGPLGGALIRRLLWHELLETGVVVCLSAFHFFSWLRVCGFRSRMVGFVFVFVGWLIGNFFVSNQ